MILDINRSIDLRWLLISGATYIHPVFLSIVLARASIFQQSNIFFERLLCSDSTLMLIHDDGREKLMQNKMDFFPKHFFTVLGENKVFPNCNNDYDIVLTFLTLYQSKCCLGRVWIWRRKKETMLDNSKTWVVVKRGRQEKLLGNVTRIPTCLLQREKSAYCTFLQLGQMFNGLRKAHTTQHPLSVHPAFLCHQKYHLVFQQQNY